MKNTLIRAVAGLIAAAALFVGISNVRQVYDAAKLRQSHATATGVISSKSVGDHGVVDYVFAVGGKEYRAQGVGGAQRVFGANVTVYYYPDDPSLSLLHDPLVWRSSGWSSAVIPLGISCIGFCIAVGWMKSGSSSSS